MGHFPWLNSQRVVNPSGCSAPCHLSPFLAAASSGNSRSISWKKDGALLWGPNLLIRSSEKMGTSWLCDRICHSFIFYHTSQLKHRNKLWSSGYIPMISRSVRYNISNIQWPTDISSQVFGKPHDNDPYNDPLDHNIIPIYPHDIPLYT